MTYPLEWGASTIRAGDFVKVYFRVRDPKWPQISGERIWVRIEKISRNRKTFVGTLANDPVFAIARKGKRLKFGSRLPVKFSDIIDYFPKESLGGETPSIRLVPAEVSYAKDYGRTHAPKNGRSPKRNAFMGGVFKSKKQRELERAAAELGISPAELAQMTPQQRSEMLWRSVEMGLEEQARSGHSGMEGLIRGATNPQYFFGASPGSYLARQQDRGGVNVAFTTDKRGRPVAYLWHTMSMRWMRVPFDEAKAAIAAGAAREVRYRK